MFDNRVTNGLQQQQLKKKKLSKFCNIVFKQQIILAGGGGPLILCKFRINYSTQCECKFDKLIQEFCDITTKFVFSQTRKQQKFK